MCIVSVISELGQTDRLLLVKFDTNEFKELADYLTKSKGHTHGISFMVCYRPSPPLLLTRLLMIACC